MINPQELADVFLDEAHNQARSISFQEFPDLPICQPKLWKW